MIYILSIIAVLLSIVLPWWTALISFTLIGYMYVRQWRDAFVVALIAAVLEVAVAAFYDFQAQGLASRRIASVFQGPSWMAYLAPALMGAWMGLFCSRLGGAIYRVRQNK